MRYLRQNALPRARDVRQGPSRPHGRDFKVSAHMQEKGLARPRAPHSPPQRGLAAAL
jgi:hypothetical protein